MKSFILSFFILISFKCYSSNILILSSELHRDVITNYVNMLPVEHTVRGIILNKTSDEPTINNRIFELHPNLILFIGDLAIQKFLIKYREQYKQFVLMYCCNLLDYNNETVSGIKYVVDYIKLESIIRNFENVYILRSNIDKYEHLTFFIFENLKSIPIKIELLIL